MRLLAFAFTIVFVWTGPRILRPLEVTVEVVGLLNDGLIIVERGYQTERIYSLI